VEFDVNKVWASTLKWSRTAHIYMTLAAMLLLFFFAITGFMMNHAEWFKPDKPPIVEQVSIPAEVLKGDNFTIVEHLRKTLGGEGEAKFVEARARDGGGAREGAAQRKTVQFRLPGKSMDVSMNLETGEARVTRQNMGFYGVMTDMHKGKQSTAAWKILTDATAFMLAGAVITGFIMWLGMKRRRAFGIIGLAGSVIVAAALFALAVR
jgi:hypothetical protein